MGRASFLQQTWFLLYRNKLIKTRRTNQTFQEIVFPVFLLIILVVLSKAFPSTTYQPVASFDSIPLTTTNFVTNLQKSVLAYTPNNSPQVKSIMDSVVLRLNLTDIMPMENEGDIQNYYKNNPGKLGVGIVFQLDANSLNLSTTNPQVTFLMNGTYIPETSSLNGQQSDCYTTDSCTTNGYLFSGFLTLQQTIEQVLFEQRTGFNVDFNITLRQLPKPFYQDPNQSISTLAAIYVVWGEFLFFFV